MKTNKLGGSEIITVLALAGIAGPILFWALLLIAQSLHPGYDALENSVSRLIFSPFGWVQTMNYCLLALFTAAFGMMVYLGIAQSRTARMGSLLLMVMGLIPLLVAMFRVDVNPSGLNSLPYIIHKVVAVVGGVSFPLGALLLVPELRSDERWRCVSPFTVAAAGVILTLQLGEASVFIVPHLIDPWFGLYERVLLSIPLAWMMLVSARFLYIRRQCQFTPNWNHTT